MLYAIIKKLYFHAWNLLLYLMKGTVCDTDFKIETSLFVENILFSPSNVINCSHFIKSIIRFNAF